MEFDYSPLLHDPRRIKFQNHDKSVSFKTEPFHLTNNSVGYTVSTDSESFIMEIKKRYKSTKTVIEQKNFYHLEGDTPAKAHIKDGRIKHGKCKYHISEDDGIYSYRNTDIFYHGKVNKAKGRGMKKFYDVEGIGKTG